MAQRLSGLRWKVSWTTRLILVAVGMGILYANLMESRLVYEYNAGANDQFGRIGSYFFTRGWPLSPWMFCTWHGGKWHPEEGFTWGPLSISAWWVLVADVALLLVALILVAMVSECLIALWRNWPGGRGRP
jgi:hypothetical protein